MSTTAIQNTMPNTEESRIAELLESRFGDGLNYISKHHSARLFNQAIEQGFVDQDGYLTRKGRSLITRYHFNL